MSIKKPSLNSVYESQIPETIRNHILFIPGWEEPKDFITLPKHLRITQYYKKYKWDSRPISSKIPWVWFGGYNTRAKIPMYENFNIRRELYKIFISPNIERGCLKRPPDFNMSNVNPYNFITKKVVWGTHTPVDFSDEGKPELIGKTTLQEPNELLTDEFIPELLPDRLQTIQDYIRDNWPDMTSNEILNFTNSLEIMQEDSQLGKAQLVEALKTYDEYLEGLSND